MAARKNDRIRNKVCRLLHALELSFSQITANSPATMKLPFSQTAANSLVTVKRYQQAIQNKTKKLWHYQPKVKTRAAATSNPSRIAGTPPKNAASNPAAARPNGMEIKARQYPKNTNVTSGTMQNKTRLPRRMPPNTLQNFSWSGSRGGTTGRQSHFLFVIIGRFLRERGSLQRELFKYDHNGSDCAA